MSNAVEINHLAVSFAQLAAVDDVSLAISYGEVVALLGPNGAGKTTIVETLLGFRPPTSGTVRLHGLDPIRDHREVVARTGALLQRGGVWFPMTPRQVLDLTATYYDAPRGTDELLDLLALERCQSTPWRRLSGGEQQRTLLALALLGRPRALVLDEPTTAVDPEGRQVIRNIIATERDRGCALLITTHELDEAERLADRLVIIHHGHVVAQGRLDELAGRAEMIIEVSKPVNVAALANALGCEITQDSPLRLRCSTESSPERIATVTTFLTSVGSSMTSLRTRASLEERYLELIAEERGPVRS
ncbi:MAG: ABC transporter ATP-binding protein [Acidimicrobiaceae bacterium]|nr:ABC transporter ATP-binding protein [Acidimicrobiaceae bacterium]